MGKAIACHVAEFIETTGEDKRGGEKSPCTVFLTHTPSLWYTCSGQPVKHQVIGSRTTPSYKLTEWGWDLLFGVCLAVM